MTPELFKHIRRIEYKTKKLVEDIFQGAYKSRFKGKGLEFEEVRPYLPGDDIRSIDWNVTARMNFPYIKNFQEERELTVMLLVDQSRSTLLGTSSPSKKETIAEIGALLSFAAVKNHDNIGLILFSDKIDLYLPPAKGIRHVLRIVREILLREPTGAKTNIQKALSLFNEVMKRPSICFLISDFLAEGFESAYKIAAKKNDLISIRVLDPYEYQFPLKECIELTSLEGGKKTLIDAANPEVEKRYREISHRQRESFETLVKKTGSDLIEIESGKDIIEPLKKYFSRTRAR